WPHAAATGLAFACACVVALIGGLVLGLALGANRLAGEIGEPIISSLYSIPKITLYPVILLVFGLGVSAKVAFGALHGIFPVALFAIGALRNTSPVLIKTARVLRLAGRNRAHRAVARGAAGNRHRASHRLFGDVARHADRRAFRLRSRPGLHADSRHGGAQGARYHGPDAAAVRICRERECAVARRRAARAPTVSAAALAGQPHRLMLLWNGAKFTSPHDAIG